MTAVPPTGPTPRPGEPGGSARADRGQTSSGTAALVLGILSFVVLPVVGGALALVLGYSSKRTARAERWRDDHGRVGRILGWVNVLLYGGFIALFAFPVASGGFSSGPTCVEQLEQMGGRDEVILFTCSDGQTEFNINRVPPATVPAVTPVPTAS